MRHAVTARQRVGHVQRPSYVARPVPLRPPQRTRPLAPLSPKLAKSVANKVNPSRATKGVGLGMIVGGIAGQVIGNAIVSTLGPEVITVEPVSGVYTLNGYQAVDVPGYTRVNPPSKEWAESVQWSSGTEVSHAPWYLNWYTRSQAHWGEFRGIGAYNGAGHEVGSWHFTYYQPAGNPGGLPKQLVPGRQVHIPNQYGPLMVPVMPRRYNNPAVNLPRQRTNPRRWISSRTNIAITITPTGVRVAYDVAPHRPPTGVRERKRNLSSRGYQILRSVADGMGEAIEWLEMLGEAAGSPYDSPRMIAYDLFYNGRINDVDFEALWDAILENNVEDFTWGVLGGATGESGNSLGLTSGPTTGPAI